MQGTRWGQHSPERKNLGHLQGRTDCTRDAHHPASSPPPHLLLSPHRPGGQLSVIRATTHISFFPLLGIRAVYI